MKPDHLSGDPGLQRHLPGGDDGAHGLNRHLLPGARERRRLNQRDNGGRRFPGRFGTGLLQKKSAGRAGDHDHQRQQNLQETPPAVRTSWGCHVTVCRIHAPSLLSGSSGLSDP